jgi:hypothetical protein
MDLSVDLASLGGFSPSMSGFQSRSLDLRPAYAARHTIPCWFMACVGTLTFGLFVPVFLATLYANGQPSTLGEHNNKMGDKIKHPLPEAAPDAGKVLQEFMQIQLVAFFFCGPGAVILTLILFSILKRSHSLLGTERRWILEGMCCGVALAFANIPGYLCGAIIGWHRPYAELRIALLFAAAGAVSGAWTGWQAWRSMHVEAGIFPRFSLGTLFIVMMVVAGLLAVFSPVV